MRNYDQWLEDDAVDALTGAENDVPEADEPDWDAINDARREAKEEREW